MRGPHKHSKNQNIVSSLGLKIEHYGQCDGYQEKHVQNQLPREKATHSNDLLWKSGQVSK